LLGTIKDISFIETEIDFDNNVSKWECREAKDTERKVRTFCEKNNIAFFMRSKPAIEHIRQQ
jgi:hypothetical protein